MDRSIRGLDWSKAGGRGKGRPAENTTRPARAVVANENMYLVYPLQWWRPLYSPISVRKIKNLIAVRLGGKVKHFLLGSGIHQDSPDETDGS